jgi:hypothetical protein
LYPDDEDDDFCYDPASQHPQVASYDVEFFLYIDPSEELDSMFSKKKDYEIHDASVDYSMLCDRLFVKYMREWDGMWDGSDVADSPGLASFEQHVTSGRTTSRRDLLGAQGGPPLAAVQGQYAKKNMDDVLAAYGHGPLLDAQSRQPRFLKWQPEIGYEVKRLRRKVVLWCVFLGFGWLPIIAAAAGCLKCIGKCFGI